MIERYFAFLGFIITGILTLLVVIVIYLTPNGHILLLNSINLLVGYIAYYFGSILLAYLSALIVRRWPRLANLIALAYLLLTIIPIVIFPPTFISIWHHIVIPLTLAIGTLSLILIPHVLLVFLEYINAARNVTGAAAPTIQELTHRGALIGINAWMNFAFASVVYSSFIVFIFSFVFNMSTSIIASVIIGMILAVFVCVATLLCSVDPNNAALKKLLGWTTWAMPMAWIVEGLGCLLYYLNLIGHILLGWIPGNTGNFFRIESINILGEFGSIVTIGGICSNLNIYSLVYHAASAYNMGTFIFVYFDPGTSPQLELHEAGHQLNLCAFGSHFHFIGWFDEMLYSSLTSTNAYAERLAEGNTTSTTFTPIDMW